MEKCSISFMWFRFGHLDAPMMSKKMCVCVGRLTISVVFPSHTLTSRSSYHLKRVKSTVVHFTDWQIWLSVSPIKLFKVELHSERLLFCRLNSFFPFVIICSRQHVRVLLRGNIIYLFFALIWREKLHCSSNNTCDICMEILLLLC